MKRLWFQQNSQKFSQTDDSITFYLFIIKFIYLSIYLFIIKFIILYEKNGFAEVYKN